MLAKWSSNSYFYSGSITRDLGENRFRLLFDDNQECEVQGKDILLCDPIPLETEVTALTEEEFFNIGMIYRNTVSIVNPKMNILSWFIHPHFKTRVSLCLQWNTKDDIFF